MCGDVVFVLDESTSIIDEEFCIGHGEGTFKALTDFAAAAVDVLASSIDKGWVRVGGVLFSTRSKGAIPLGQGMSASSIHTQFTALTPPARYSAGGLMRETTSNIHLGLREAKDMLAASANNSSMYLGSKQHIVVGARQGNLPLEMG